MRPVIKNDSEYVVRKVVHPPNFRPQPIDQFRWHAHIRYRQCQP